MLDIFRDEADDEPGDEYDGYSEKYYLNRSNLTCGCPECLKNDWENCSCEMSRKYKRQRNVVLRQLDVESESSDEEESSDDCSESSDEEESSDDCSN